MLLVSSLTFALVDQSFPLFSLSRSILDKTTLLKSRLKNVTTGRRSARWKATASMGSCAPPRFIAIHPQFAWRRSWYDALPAPSTISSRYEEKSTCGNSRERGGRNKEKRGRKRGTAEGKEEETRTTVFKVISVDRKSGIRWNEFEIERAITAHLGRLDLAPQLLDSGRLESVLGWMEMEAGIGDLYEYAHVVAFHPQLKTRLCRKVLTLLERVANAGVFLTDLKLANFVIWQVSPLEIRVIDFGSRTASFSVPLVSSKRAAAEEKEEAVIRSRAMAFLFWMFTTRLVRRSTRIHWPPHSWPAHMKLEDGWECLRILAVCNAAQRLVQGYCQSVLRVELTAYLQSVGKRSVKVPSHVREMAIRTTKRRPPPHRRRKPGPRRWSI